MLRVGTEFPRYDLATAQLGLVPNTPLKCACMRVHVCVHIICERVHVFTCACVTNKPVWVPLHSMCLHVLTALPGEKSLYNLGATTLYLFTLYLHRCATGGEPIPAAKAYFC
jgi:hypothetical protein